MGVVSSGDDALVLDDFVIDAPDKSKKSPRIGPGTSMKAHAKASKPLGAREQRRASGPFGLCPRLPHHVFFWYHDDGRGDSGSV